MGYVEDVQAMELSDDVKAQLISAHESEVNPLRETNQSLSARNRRESVEEEVKALGSLGFSEAPGLLKYVRRILLSGDAEEPGAVLLSDSEMELSGDQATGASGREEISVAGAIRGFIERMPRNDEGKLNLSDIAVAADNAGRPDKGDDDDPEEKAEAHKQRTQRLTGKTIDRAARSRYRR